MVAQAEGNEDKEDGEGNKEGEQPSRRQRVVTKAQEGRAADASNKQPKATVQCPATRAAICIHDRLQKTVAPTHRIPYAQTAQARCCATGEGQRRGVGAPTCSAGLSTSKSLPASFSASFTDSFTASTKRA